MGSTFSSAESPADFIDQEHKRKKEQEERANNKDRKIDIGKESFIMFC